MLYIVIFLMALLISLLLYVLVDTRDRARALEIRMEAAEGRANTIDRRLEHYEAIRKDVAVLVCSSFSEKPAWVREGEV